jgi:hypothetical protein
LLDHTSEQWHRRIVATAGVWDDEGCSARRRLASFCGCRACYQRKQLHRVARSTARVAILLALALSLAACTASWQVTVSQPDGNLFLVDAEVLHGLNDFSEQVEGKQAIPVERVLVAAGHSVVDELVVFAERAEGDQSFEWASAADGAWWLYDGSLLMGGERVLASHLEVAPSPLLEHADAAITDVAPTVSTALSIGLPDQATGRPLDVPAAEQVVLILLDGFGYVRYTEALAEGLIPSLESLGEPLVAVTAYPPITSVATASVLTGAGSEVHGVDQRGIRKTETETVFDVAASAGLEVVAVEGESLAFELRGAELQLSADLDGNGTTDDNVLANALAVLSGGAPDIFFVHFHGIDDAGHTYGPGAPEERAAIQEEDRAVGRIVELLPEHSLVVIFADHGMHQVNEEGRLGNHGHLVERDMLIPIFVVVK